MIGTDEERVALLPDHPTLKDYGMKGKKPIEETGQTLKVGEESCQLAPLLLTSPRNFLYYAIIVLTAGFGYLVFLWFRKLYIKTRFVSCNHFEATHISIIDPHEQLSVKAIYTNSVQATRPKNDGNYEKVNSLRFFKYRKIMYVFYEQDGTWRNPSEIDSNSPFNHLKRRAAHQEGIEDVEADNRRTVFGTNSLQINLTPIPRLILSELTNPFYPFQLFSIILWSCDQYQFYAGVILCITLVSMVMDVYQLRKQEKKVKSMASGDEFVEVIRDNQVVMINADMLVPGDIIQLESHDYILPCDALLIDGVAIVNEAMLTGESVAVTKVQLSSADEVADDIRYSPERHNRHTLFRGTKVLQTRIGKGKVRALVVRTGFSTLKGQLVRAVMYPKPMDKEYTKDLLFFVLLLAIIAGSGSTYTIILMILRREDLRDIIVRSLDIVTIVVPPALPAAMSVGVIRANSRLNSEDIFCIQQSTINTCGQINVVAFDKTGTLTQDGMDFNCLKAVKMVEGRPEFTDEIFDLEPENLKNHNAKMTIMQAAATCHSLTRIDGELNGDPLEVILFQLSKWILKEFLNNNDETTALDFIEPTLFYPPPEHLAYHPGNSEYSQIRQFPFHSSLQRMSVIVSNPSDDTAHDMSIYTKGSPEMIQSLCDPATLPKDYSNIVDEYAQRGYRLIAVAQSKVELNYARALKAPRETLECDMEFLGLIVMENKLKDATLKIINEFFVAGVRTVMITGDNLLTAMSVSRECGIVRPTKKAFLITHDSKQKDHLGRTKIFIKESVSSSADDIDTDSTVQAFDKKLHLQPSKYHVAIAGPTYNIIVKEYPSMLPMLTATCDVYARMSPDQKAALIVDLQNIDYKVMMVGDGANDCSALKTANAGISLSEAEASIAAPFTSKVPDISCAVTVMREGRCAIVTSFSIFTYMAAYSLEEFCSVLLLYYFGTNLTNGMFLFIDLCNVTIPALFIGDTGPAPTLHRKPPPARLASVASVVAVIGQLVITIGTQLLVVLLTLNQSWYTDSTANSYQGTALFLTTCYRYLGFIFVYSQGAPYRKPIYTNRRICVVVLILITANSLVCFGNCSWIYNIMGFQPIPSIGFKFELLAVSIVSIGVSIAHQQLIVQYLVRHIVDKKLHEKRLQYQHSSLPQHELLLAKYGVTPVWFDEKLREASAIKHSETEF